MDDIVKAAMAKWPNVPAVFGWLSLNGRGNWRIKDDPIDNEAINEFIGRNYMNDGCGNCFSRMGRSACMSLLKLRRGYTGSTNSSGSPRTRRSSARVRQAFADENGRLYFETEWDQAWLGRSRHACVFGAHIDVEGQALDDKALADWNAGESLPS